MNGKRIITVFTFTALLFSACKKDDKDMTTTTGAMGKDPNTAEKASIDRFSEAAGMLMVRNSTNGLPGPNVAINFDQGPFITKGLGPGGNKVEYYNFDVQPTTPAPIYVLMKNGSMIDGQLNIINVIPGDAGYNDFWQVNTVEVPSDYVTNSVTSFTEIQDKGYKINATSKLVNCPVVPEGSVAVKRGGSESAALTKGWYKGKLVFYFNFFEKELTAVNNKVPTSPIYVTFKINPDQPNGGPSSGFVTEMDMMQTHNVVATMPSDAGYSPLWSVNVYDNADFDMVNNLATAQMANILATGVALVNCPVVTK